MKLNSNTSGLGILLVIALALAVFILGPLAVIWSANTLFNFTIPYTFDTWVATLLIGAFLRGESLVSFKK